MANIKSKKKRILTNEKSRLRNVHYVSRMKSFIKKCIHSIENKAESAFEDLVAAQKIIDKTCSKGSVTANAASRKKARLMRLANKHGITKATQTNKVVTPKKTLKKSETTKKTTEDQKSANAEKKVPAKKETAKSTAKPKTIKKTVKKKTTDS